MGTGLALDIPKISARGQAVWNAKDIFQIIKSRRSVRRFKSIPIPEEHITIILDAARSAPTSGNQQQWKFVFIQNKANIGKLKKDCISKSLSTFKKRKKPDEQEGRDEVGIKGATCQWHPPSASLDGPPPMTHRPNGRERSTGKDGLGRQGPQQSRGPLTGRKTPPPHKEKAGLLPAVLRESKTKGG